MSNQHPRFSQLAITTIVVHTVTYSVVGILAFWLFDYGELYARPDLAGLMRQTNDPIIMAGPAFQPLRGLVFALAIYPLREIVFARPRGWLVLWGLFVALGIVSTFGPAPGSIEGLIYTVVSVPHQLLGLVEVVVQALLLAFGVVYGVNHPEKHWLNRLMIVVFALLILLPLAGLLAGPRGG
ncbi:MAG: hypothetical protein GTN78_00570 [Gemmatimonadales bacterium]|nr:hypothetical protein [Gemmatimonadales bacterium]NIN10033.1 hypothetical protein [Gemmatimonadales bacterium]NIQ98685.1 hypothetical protein [Gemmatimonadales bacterium]NIS63562.1 hypothetical protein [Gemmatimonadales bacterium]